MSRFTSVEFESTFFPDFAYKQMCYRCGRPIVLGCGCEDKSIEELHFNLSPEDLPPLDAPLETQIVFFEKLVRHGNATRRAVNFPLFYQEQIEAHNTLTHMRNPAVKRGFEAVWKIIFAAMVAQY